MEMVIRGMFQRMVDIRDKHKPQWLWGMEIFIHGIVGPSENAGVLAIGTWPAPPEPRKLDTAISKIEWAICRCCGVIWASSSANPYAQMAATGDQRRSKR